MSPRAASPSSTRARSRSARNRASATIAGLEPEPPGSSCLGVRPPAVGVLALAGGREEQLHVRARGLLAAARAERLEGLEQGAAQLVHGAENGGERSEVAGEGEELAPGVGLHRPAFRSEHLQVRVAKPVDRLELVSNLEDPCRRAAQQLDELELHAARVLELVDHEVGEALAPEGGHRLRLAQERHRPQLEVGEVESRTRGLRALVAGGEGLEHGLEGAPGGARSIELGRRERRGLLLLALPRAHRLAHLGKARALHALAAQAPERGHRDLSHPPGPVGGDRKAVSVGIGLDHARDRLARAALTQPHRLGLVEHPKAGIQACSGRVRREQAPAEAVDGRDPGGLGRPGGVEELGRALRVTALALRARPPRELRADPAPQLGRGPLGEREREDLLDAEPVLGDRVAVALHQDARLSGPGAGLQQHVAVAQGDRA